jgi:hypothetical protein
MLAIRLSSLVYRKGFFQLVAQYRTHMTIPPDDDRRPGLLCHAHDFLSSLAKSSLSL